MRLFFFIIAMIYSFNAIGWTSETSDKVWRSGYGQGTAEAEVTHGSGNRIYVACEAGSGRDSSISFMLVGDGPKNASEIMLIFDNGDPETVSIGFDGAITSDSHASDSNFRYVIAKFKKHNSVYVRFPDGRESNFTLKGAAKALGDCSSTFP